MAKVLILYYSQSGNTKAMAQLVAEGARSAGAHGTCKSVTRTEAGELLKYDAIIAGSPTYYGTMAWQMKKLIDDSVKYHGKLIGKVGAAFSSAANIGGGNETTVMDIIDAWLIHGMIVQGSAEGDHYGPVSIGKPDARVKKQCLALGKRVAELCKQLGK